MPFLGSIPLLGELFKTRSVNKTKTNLMVFIRPRILRDGVDAAIETNAKYNYIREQQRRCVRRQGAADAERAPAHAPAARAARAFGHPQADRAGAPQGTSPAVRTEPRRIRASELTRPLPHRRRPARRR